jgi:type VI protein secretion system component Hcp
MTARVSGGAGKVKFGELDVTMPVGAYSPTLLRGVLAGEHFGTVTLTEWSTPRGGPREAVATWTMETALVTADKITSGPSGSGGPIEEVHLAYQALQESVPPQPVKEPAATPPGLPPDPAAAKHSTTGPATYTLSFESDSIPPLPTPASAIKLDSFQYEVDNRRVIGSATSGGGAGQAKLGEMDVTMPAGDYSPILLGNLLAGSHYSTVTLTEWKSAPGRPPVAVATWTMGTGFVAADKITSGPSGSDAPIEEVHLAYTSLQESVPPQPVKKGAPGTPPGLSSGPAATKLPTAGPASYTLSFESSNGASMPASPIDLDTFQFEVDNPHTLGSGTGAGGPRKINFGDLDVTMPVGDYSPILLKHLTTDTPYQTVTLTEWKSAPGGRRVAVATWTMQTVAVAGDHITGGSSGSNSPTEEVDFLYKSLQESVPPQPVKKGAPGTPPGPSSDPAAAKFPASGPAFYTLSFEPDKASGTSAPARPIKLGSFRLGWTKELSIGSKSNNTKAARVKIDELDVTMRVGDYSPMLHKSVTTGCHFGTVTLTEWKRAPGRTPVAVATWTMGTVSATADQVTGGSGADSLKEEVHFAYAAIEEAVGNQVTTWNQLTNTDEFNPLDPS